MAGGRSKWDEAYQADDHSEKKHSSDRQSDDRQHITMRQLVGMTSHSDWLELEINERRAPCVPEENNGVE